jgi:hypothetical protein
MRIPNIVLDCVGFFYVYGSQPGPDVADHGGTGFFLTVSGNLVQHMYLVTAKHVALEAPKAGDGRVFLRYSAPAASALAAREVHSIEVEPEGWRFHPDPSVDVAVQHFRTYAVNTKAQVLPRPLTTKALLTKPKVEKYKVGIGDELSVVGLFRHRPGIEEHIPIVRHGIISAMPGEPIPHEDGLPPYVAYLAEIKSTRGLSGSPVFVNLALGRHADGTYNESGTLALIGLVRGHFERRRGLTSVFDRQMTEEERELMAVNTGIAMVTPISTVIDILDSREALQERGQAEQMAARVVAEGTTDSGFAAKARPFDAETSGPEAERLAIGLPMDEAVKKVFEAGKPLKGDL